MPIRRLPPEVANRIAAGEIIERPASVVKELVENAIDAGASRIEVEIGRGGVSFIRVRDDGCGMTRDDLALAFERHATSKLVSADDLWAIGTLGFRGEALPSIAAAAAEVEVTSRQPEDLAGSRLDILAGAIVSHTDRGSAAGTTVMVRELFANQPARRSFLRSTSSETRAVLDVVANTALARPDVAITLASDGRTVFRSAGGGLRDATVAVYGRAVAIELLEAGSAVGEVRVEGLVGGPQQHRASRSGIVFVVNGRPISDRSLAFAVEEAYRGLLPRGRRPIAVLSIELPSEAVDVNVHPAKAQVRFREERTVFAAVQRAVRSALMAASPAATLGIPQPPLAPLAADQGEFGPPLHAPPQRQARPSEAPPARSQGGESEPPRVAPFPPLRAVGQIGDTYVVAEGPDGLYLVDQHAAHERVMFEQLRARRAERHPDVQMLLEPATLELSARQAMTVERDGEALGQLGLVIEPFGESGVIVRAVPASLAVRGEAATAVGSLLDALADGRRAEGDDRVVATLACHASVRAGMTLSPDEQRALLRQLEAARQPRTCPHGRPTMIHLSAEALERGFGRR